jgi:hypothetical protein
MQLKSFDEPKMNPTPPETWHDNAPILMLLSASPVPCAPVHPPG